MVEQEDKDPEKVNIEGAEDESPEVTPKPMLWLRPITGLFSIITALMYFCAACLFMFYRMSFQYYSNLSSEEKLEKVQFLQERGQSTAEATKAVDLAVEFGNKAAPYFGTLFVVSVAAIAFMSIVICVSGIGMFLKKSWSVSLGRLSCVAMIVAVVALFVVHQPGLQQLTELRQEQGAENIEIFGWMATVRYIFLCSMCPISLIIAYGMVIKQYKV